MTRPIKYIITPEMDKIIKDAYDTGKNKIEIANKIGISRHSITRYAILNNYVKVSRKVKIWTDEELKIVKANARFTPDYIQKKLKKVGFSRTISSIQSKLSKGRFLSNLKGQSATQLAECFGVSVRVICGWIKSEKLKATRRGTSRDSDHWYIMTSNILKFIIEYPEHINLNKVDKYWFIDLAFGGKDGLSAIKTGNSVGEGGGLDEAYGG